MNVFCSHFKALALIFILVSSVCAEEERFWAFSYFTGNGEDGLHLLVSRDAMNWETTNHRKPFLAPDEGTLMRDPSICRSPDGTFHLVWTLGWKGLAAFGHSTSNDLIHWSKAEQIPVMQDEPAVRNVWAPEVFYDAPQKTFYIFWASTIPGRFSTEGTSESQYDHRIYFVKTRDWKTFTPTQLFFEPGHNVIDAFMAEKDGVYYLFYKDETLHPERKVIVLATSNTPEGPWDVQGDISPVSWVEGPSALDLGSQWLVCYDCYAKHAYGAISSPDGKHWTDVSADFHVPGEIRHGTMFQISKELYENLKSLDEASRSMNFN